MADGGELSIGRVAERVGLSLRTIRYYEEMGLIRPSGRSIGGFRLYGDAEVARLLLIKRMKPLGYPLDAMAELLRVIDTVHQPVLPDAVEAARSRLGEFADEVAERVERLRVELAHAEEFRDRLSAELRLLHELGAESRIPTQPQIPQARAT